MNHHLAQILERVVAVGAIQRGPVIAEVGTFNGDEPLGPGTSPDFHRFGDSWSSRVTLLPLAGMELSGSLARVRSPEERSGAGLSQHKASVVGRYARQSSTSAATRSSNGRARTSSIVGETDHDAEQRARRGSVLPMGRGRRGAGRAHGPSGGGAPGQSLSHAAPVARSFEPWRLAMDDVHAIALESCRAGRVLLGAAIRRGWNESGAAAGNPPGIFNPEILYGARSMWMVSAGARLVAGRPHLRMGRYGAALPSADLGTHTTPGESHSMPGMPGMPEMPSDAHDMAPGSSAHPSISQCSP